MRGHLIVPRPMMSLFFFIVKKMQLKEKKEFKLATQFMRQNIQRMKMA